MHDVNPATTGLLVFDLVETYRPAIEEAGVIPAVRALIDECRKHDVPVLYARPDHRPDGSDRATAPTDTDSSLRPWSEERQPSRIPRATAGSPESQVIAEIAPLPEDYIIFKHRWSAFFQTPLELTLRTRGITTLLVTGGSTHVGVGSTVYAGRDLDFDMVVVRDCVTGLEEQREFFIARVFPRMCRVRSSKQIIDSFRAA